MKKLIKLSALIFPASQTKTLNQSTTQRKIDFYQNITHILYVLQGATNTAAVPAIHRLDLGTMPAVQNGIVTLPDTQRYSSYIMGTDYNTYLPITALNQIVYVVPGANHGAGITGVPAVFLTRGTAAVSRVGRVTTALFNTGISTTNRARASNVTTLTFASHPFTVNQRVYVQGVGGTGYNSAASGREPGTWAIVTFANATTIQYVNVGANESTTPDTGGTVVAAIITEDDYITDIPPLGPTIQQAANNWSGLSYDANNDYFIICTNGSFRDYRTTYTPGQPVERFFGTVNFETNPLASGSLPDVWSTMLTVRQAFGGRTLIVARQGLTAAVATAQQLLLMEAGAQGGYVITPQITTANATQYYRVYTSEVRGGSGSYGKERYDIYYRTSGITDNSGAWTKINDEANLTNVTAASSIQFKIVFDILNWTCISPEITSLALIWEDGSSTDSHYQPSVGKSSVTAKQFAWRLATAFGGTVPSLRVRLYDATNDNLQADDNTSTNPAGGTFEQTTNDGANWSVWTNADKTNDTTYIRYTPASTPNNIRIKALLTLL